LEGDLKDAIAMASLQGFTLGGASQVRPMNGGVDHIPRFVQQCDIMRRAIDRNAGDFTGIETCAINALTNGLTSGPVPLTRVLLSPSRLWIAGWVSVGATGEHHPFLIGGDYLAAACPHIKP
jgi:hypothetical protein